LPELLLLAIASAFWPTLLAVVAVSLRAPHPVRLLASFTAGGLLTTVGVGLVVVYALQGTSLVTTSRHTTDPAVELVVGCLAVVTGVVLMRVRLPRLALKTEPRREKEKKGPGLVERVVARGALLAFTAGVLLNVVPGFFPLVALKDISELNYAVAATAGILLAFYIVMFAFVEVPLGAFLIAPERAERETLRFNSWLNANARRLASWALIGIGVVLIVKAIVSLID
jgi:Sap-like sulfolipid-1-addressing protein